MIKLHNLKKLDPHGIQKSFYGKAWTAQDETGAAYLYSYNTLVACIADGFLYRCWGGYSATTLRHVDAFCAEFGSSPAPNKSRWDEMPLAHCRKHDKVDGSTSFPTYQHMRNWVDAKPFFRGLGGREYERNGVHYSKDPSGRLVHKVTFDELGPVSWLPNAKVS